MTQQELETRILKIEYDLTNSQENVPKHMRTLVAVFTLGLWLLLVVLGLVSVWSSWQSSFFNSVDKVLLPVFKATIAASLTYIFGFPVANALARRLTRISH